MQKKKSAKSTKTKKIDTKRPVKNTKPSKVDHFGLMEKEFNDAPKKMVASLRKDLAALKSQEKKLKSELKKAQAQKKQAKNKRTTLAAKFKDKQNATNKKLFANAKAAYDQVSKNISTTSEQHSELKAQVKALTQKTNRYNALTKLLSQFDKQWALKLKPAATKVKKKATKKTKPSQDLNEVESTQQSADHQHHDSHHESVETEQNEPVEASAKKD